MSSSFLRGLLRELARRGTCPGDTARPRAPCARSRPRAARRRRSARPTGPAPAPGSTGRLRSTGLPVSSNMRAHAAELLARDDRSRPACSVPRLHQHRRHRRRGPSRAATRCTTPAAGRRAAALSSSTSACSRIASSSSSMPCAGLAPTRCTNMRVAAPFLGDHVRACESSLRTRSGSASGLSILLIATTIGTFGRPRVLDRFDGLRHDAVVGRDHQHHDVGDLARRARASR